MANSVLSKIKVNDAIYDLKDAAARADLGTLVGSHAVEALGTAAWLDSVGTVAEGGTNLPTAGAVHTAIQNAVADLVGAMHFRGVVTKNEGETDLEALARAITDAESGDIAIIGVKEYVYDGVTWQELGDESIYLTTATAAKTYVAMTRTIAGIDLQDDITAEEIKTALGLKALAYKDTASVTLTDYATGIEDAKYTPAGSVAVTLSQTSTAMESTGSFKPSGTVSGTTTAAGTVSIAKSEAGTQISGTVSAPTITVTPATAQVQHIDSVGTLPTYTAAQYTAPSVNEAKSSFATEGVVASMAQDDAEMLVISAATKSNALTGTGFNAGSYTAAEFNAGTLPTLGAAQTVVTGITKAEASAPVFTGDKFGATFAGTEADITATFDGTEGNVSVSGNYDKAGVESAGFTGTEATIAHTLLKGSKVVTVE